MLLMIPPRLSVANTIGYLKGKSAIRRYRLSGVLQVGLVGMTGLGEQVREYIKNQ